MRLPRWFRTASFRLAALHLLLSGATLAIVGLVVIWDLQNSLEGQVKERLLQVSDDLRAQLDAQGPERVREIIQNEARIVGGLDFRLEARDGRLLAGLLPAVPRVAGWTTLDLTERALGEAGQARALALVAFSHDGHLLAVGEDVRSVTRARSAVGQTFATAILVVVVLGVIGGVLLNALFLRRVQHLADAARGVMNGDLSQRIPPGAPDEFGWLANAFNHMLDRTVSLVELNRQIGSAIAHDLRSPLTRLLRHLETASLDAGRADHERTIQLAIDDVHDMLATFNAILRIAQVEAGTRKAGFKRVDIGALTASIADTYTPVAQDEGKELVADAQAELWVEGDRELLTQLASNLIENAIRHTPPGITVAVSARREGERILVAVADDGPGIPAESRSKVLERFVRLDPARSTPGSGLGLTLCAAILDLHDASLALEDNRPGLRCAMSFPAAGARAGTYTESYSPGQLRAR